MKKAVIGSIAVVVLLGGGFVVYQARRLQSEAAKWAGPVQEIVEESIAHEGPITNVRFVSLIDGPVSKVEASLWSVEKSKEVVPTVKASNLFEEKNNTKIVEMVIQALSLPATTYVMEFKRQPENNRIVFKTIKAQAQDIEGTYQLEASPDGAKTRLVYTSRLTDRVTLPFPQSVLDGANREIYVNTVRGIKKSLEQG